MRRTAIAVAVTLLVAASGGASVAAGAATARPAAATISVVPSTHLVAGQSVLVSGGGFAANTPLGSAECKSGATVLADCDLSTANFPEADASGAYSFHEVVHTELVTDNGLVDCTASAGTCVIGVASSLDIADAVTAPISFAPPAPPQSGVMQVPSAPVGADNGAVVTGTDYAPLGVVGVALCATAPTDVTQCAVPNYVATDETGAFSTYLNTPEHLSLQDGDSVHCTVVGKCVFATWDARDFADTLTTTPMSVALEVAGSVTVTPHSDLADGQTVTVRGTGWPAQDFLGIAECTGTGATAVCDDYSDAQVDDDGTFTTPFSVSGQSTSGQGFNCAVDPCSVVVTWYALGGDVAASRPISFTTVPEVAHYSTDELSAIQQAATQLGITTAQLQHDGSLALDWVLHIAHVATITPAADTGAHTVETDWLPAEHASLTDYAASEGATLPEFEKTGAIFVAFVLAYIASH